MSTNQKFIMKLSKKIDMLVAIFSKYQFNEDAKAHYVSSLLRFENNPHLFPSIDELAKGTKFPYIQEIIDEVSNRTKRNPQVIEKEKRLDAPVEKPLETRNSALMSILWLYYSKVYSRYDLEQNSSGNVVLETFRRMFPGEQFSVDKLELEFPREKVEAWMKHQELIHS